MSKPLLPHKKEKKKVTKTHTNVCMNLENYKTCF